MDNAIDRNSLFCERCKEEGLHHESVSWCVNCQSHFCSECIQDKIIKRKNHEFLSTMKYREFLLNCYFGKFHSCFVHSDVDSKYYCLKHKTTCCEKCKRQVHSSCSEIVKPEKVAMSIRTSTEFPDLIERLKDAILSFETLINENFENRHKLEILKNKVINDLFQMREDINNHLERIQSELLEQLETSYDQQIGLLDNIASYMEDIKEEVHNLKSDTEIVAEKLPDLELFFFLKTAETRHLVTETAIHELRKSSIEIKLKHDVESGMRELSQIQKQLMKLTIKGDNISSRKLDEWNAERQRKDSTKSTEVEDLRLHLPPNTPSTTHYPSPRDNITSRMSFKSDVGTVNPAFFHTNRSKDSGKDNFSIGIPNNRGVSRASEYTMREHEDNISQTSFKSSSRVIPQLRRSPREYEQYLLKVKTGRLGQIRESERYVEDEESGIYTNIRNETFSIQNKVELPKLNKTSFITDVRWISRGRFIISDYNNKSLMLFDMHGTLMKESVLDDHPKCIAVISGNEVAVTISGSKKIIIIDAASLQTIRHVLAPHECEGITFTENRLIVNCIHEGIFILSKTGKILSKFPKLTGTMYLCMSNDHKLVCSMGVAGVLLVMSLEGKEIYRHKQETFKRPSGVTSDQYGNIYVASWSQSYILQVGDYGKNPKVALTSDEKITIPWGIDFDKSSDLLVVSNENGESIMIYKRHAHR